MLHLISYELMRHNCQVYSVCRFIVFVWGPTSVTETVRLIVLLLNSYTICCFADFYILLIKIIKLLESESIKIQFM